MTRNLLACCGSLTLDNVVLADGRYLPRSCGGNVVYSALAARLWHDRVGLVSRVGVDYPESFLTLLADQGLDLGGVVRGRGAHGMNVAFSYRPDGSRVRAFPPHVMAAIPPEERARFVDYTTLGVAHRFGVWNAFSPDGSEVPDSWLSSLRGVHCAAMPVESHVSIAGHVRASDATAAWLQVDSPWYDERDLAVDHAQSLFSRIDALLPSEDDVQKAYPETDIRRGVARIFQAGAKLVVLKRGSAGCMVFQADGSTRTLPVLATDIVDLTGAGDAFCGGFLAGMALGDDPVTAAMYGTVSASFAIEGPGISRLLAATPAEASQRLTRLRRIS